MLFVVVVFFVLAVAGTLVVAGIGLTAADGLAVVETGVLIAAFVTAPVPEDVAVPAPVVEVVAALPAEALPVEPDLNEVRLLAVPGVRVGKFRL